MPRIENPECPRLSAVLVANTELDLRFNLDSMRHGLKGWSRKDLNNHLRRTQIAVYVMVGGGLLGRMAAEQPADFYIDCRVGKLPYKRDEIYQAVEVLKVMAETLGYGPKGPKGPMPAMDHFHGCGVF